MKATYGLSRADVCCCVPASVTSRPGRRGSSGPTNSTGRRCRSSSSTRRTRKASTSSTRRSSNRRPPRISSFGRTRRSIDPELDQLPGPIDARWPAFESPAEMVQMFCRYRCALGQPLGDPASRARPLRSAQELGDRRDGQRRIGRMPRTRPNEALLVSVHGLAIEGIGDRLRTFLLHAQNRHVIFSVRSGTSSATPLPDGLLLRVPRWAELSGQVRAQRRISHGRLREGPRLPHRGRRLDDLEASLLRGSARCLSDASRRPRAAAQKRRVQA